MRLIFTIVLLLTACTMTIQPPPHIDSAMPYLLQLADMPAGFTMDSSVTALRSNEQLAQGYPDPDAFLSNLERWGRQGGYIVTYSASGLDAMLGIAHIEHSVIIYSDTDGAKAYIDDWVERGPVHGDGGKVTRFVPVSAPSFGDYSIAYRTEYTVNNAPENMRNLVRYTVAFVKHNVLVYVETFSYGGGSFNDALSLAEKAEKKFR